MVPSRRFPALGHALWFGADGDMPLEDTLDVMRAFLDEVVSRQSFDRARDIEPFLAPAMARRHCELFEACL